MMKAYRLLLFAFALLLSACSFSLAEDITPPPGAAVQPAMPTQPPLSGPLYPLVAPNPAEGATIFAEKCAPCHGTRGLGDGPQSARLSVPPAALGSPEIARKAAPVDWYRLITQGNLERFMPPFANLSERQKWDVIAYAFTLSNPPEIIAQGAQLYQANCADCHGENGQGDGAEAAKLTTSPTDFTNQEWMAGKSAVALFQSITAGLPPDMPAFDKFSEGERWALTAYLRSLAFAAERATAPTTTPEGAALAEVPATPLAPTPEMSSGTISGFVTFPSGEKIAAGLEVSLHGFDNMQVTYNLTTTLAEDGSFTFTNVEMPEGRAFIASLEYQQTVYTSDVVVAEANVTDLALLIPVYASTTDSAVLSVDRLHIFLEYIEPDTLRVIELAIISNSSERTLVAAEAGQPVITFPLPEGATNLQFESGALGERFVQTPNGFGDTLAVRPGASIHQVVFAFDLPYQKKLALKQPLDLPVEAVVLMTPKNSLDIQSDQLQSGEDQTVQGSTYASFNSGRIEKGQSLSLTVSGRPKSSPAVVSGSRTQLLVGLGAFGLVLIILGIWLFRRNQIRNGGEDASEDDLEASRDASPDDADTLMDAIITLDDLYQAGELPEEAYRARRAQLKEKLSGSLAP
jgi:mono/diheme cytochrome c family protein